MSSADDITKALVYSPKQERQTAIELARKQVAEAVAATMPTVLSKMLEIAETDGHPHQFQALKWLGDKHIPNPAPERVVSTEVVEGETVSEDVREIREKLFSEWEKGKKS